MMRHLIVLAVAALVLAPRAARAESFVSDCIVTVPGDPEGYGELYVTLVFETPVKIEGSAFIDAFKRELQARGHSLESRDPYRKTLGGCTSWPIARRSEFERAWRSSIQLGSEGTVGGLYKNHVTKVEWQPTSEMYAAAAGVTPETPEQRAQRERREAEAARVEAQRKAIADKAAADRAAADAREAERKRVEDERERLETEARERLAAEREVKRREELQRRAVAGAAERRRQRDLSRAPQNKCMTKESRGTTGEMGSTNAEAMERLTRWTNRMCGSKPAVVSNVRCTGNPGLIDCKASYVCPPRPTFCPAGVTKQ